MVFCYSCPCRLIEEGHLILTSCLLLKPNVNGIGFSFWALKTLPLNQLSVPDILKIRFETQELSENGLFASLLWPSFPKALEGVTLCCLKLRERSQDKWEVWGGGNDWYHNINLLQQLLSLFPHFIKFQEESDFIYLVIHLFVPHLLPTDWYVYFSVDSFQRAFSLKISCL